MKNLAMLNKVNTALTMIVVLLRRGGFRGWGHLSAYREFYEWRSWWNPTRRNTDKQQVLFSVTGEAKGHPEDVERSEVRVGSGRLASRPQRNTERRSFSLVLWWERWRAGRQGSDCAVVGWLVCWLAGRRGPCVSHQTLQVTGTQSVEGNQLD